MLTFGNGAADARKAARLYGVAVACYMTRDLDKSRVDYVRGYTETLLVLVQAGVAA